MIDTDLEFFYREFQEEIKSLAETKNISTQDAFTEVFTSYFSESEDSLIADSEVLSYKKTRENIKINGYSFNDCLGTLTLIVSEYTPGQEIQKIGKGKVNDCLGAVYRFFNYARNGYFDDAEESSNSFIISSFIKECLPNTDVLQLVLLTNSISPQLPETTKEINKLTVKYDVWDLERLWQLVSPTRVSKQLVISLKKEYGCTLPMIKVVTDNDVYDSYVGVIPGKLLATLYRDKGQKLIEKNVRSYLQAHGKVNSGMQTTLMNEPYMFMAYNNGISTIAESISFDPIKSNDTIMYIDELAGWQIVNGGQTTASLHRALSKSDLSNVSVQMKLTVIKDNQQSADIITNISRYANSQNEIKASDFCANDEYHVKMSDLSRKVYIPSENGKSKARWFYERARGQYSVEYNRCTTPKERKEFKENNSTKNKITKTVAAKCLMLWRKQPYIVAKGLETNFTTFSDLVKTGEIPAPTEESYKSMIAKVILFNNCDEIIANLRFGGWKAQQNYYTVALVAEYFSEMVDDEYIWKHQSISPALELKIEELAYMVWNHFMNPSTTGVNIGQWCKKEECWTLLKERFTQGEL